MQIQICHCILCPEHDCCYFGNGSDGGVCFISVRRWNGKVSGARSFVAGSEHVELTGTEVMGMSNSSVTGSRARGQQSVSHSM